MLVRFLFLFAHLVPSLDAIKKLFLFFDFIDRKNLKFRQLNFQIT